MDFLNRNGQQTQPARPAATGAAPQQQPLQKHDDNNMNGGQRGRLHWGNVPGWLRVANVVLLFSITALAVAIALLLNASNPRENQYIAEDKYQAVFLQNGQVYFGKIGSLTSKYVDLQNVFYLNSNSSSSDKKTTDDSSANQFTLVKLGCELHGPYDQMIINRDQVTFWENLKDDGQVVKTINEWIKQNPNGQKCSTNTGSTDQSTSGTGTQSSATETQTNTGTSNTNTTTNKNQ